MSKDSLFVDPLNDVHIFQKTVQNDAYAGPPRLLDREAALFRCKFLGEELCELGKALGVKIKVSCDWDEQLSPISELDRLCDALDALVDLDYVLLGTVLQAGLGPVYVEAWTRVHAANMKKIAGIKSTRGYGKDAVKPPVWQAPDLSDLIQQAQDNLQ